ncbi:hypothetical protein K523DRAFT_8318 [Schizophyllum commune Tattone D]|nr:hypothetical protein K523DRAFT_8318 [Schizophyllum commune Tattone D]
MTWKGRGGAAKGGSMASKRGRRQRRAARVHRRPHGASVEGQRGMSGRESAWAEWRATIMSNRLSESTERRDSCARGCIGPVTRASMVYHRKTEALKPDDARFVVYASVHRAPRRRALPRLRQLHRTPCCDQTPGTSTRRVRARGRDAMRLHKTPRCVRCPDGAGRPRVRSGIFLFALQGICIDLRIILGGDSVSVLQQGGLDMDRERDG